LAEVAYNKEGWKKVAFIQEQLDYPLGIYKAFSARYVSLGGSIVKEEFPANTTDFRSQLTKLKAQNPDALFVDTQTPAASERIFQQMQELQWAPKLLVADIIGSDAGVVEKNKFSLEGALTAVFSEDQGNEKFQHLVSAYKAKYGGELPYASYAQTEYDAAYIVRDAIAAVGYDGEKVAGFGRSLKNWPGASGLVTIGADGDRVGGHTVKIIRNGRVENYN
jgi:branched-chain amino acid transport system substrate-binding protein